jgi:hypothetical protein
VQRSLREILVLEDEREVGWNRELLKRRAFPMTYRVFIVFTLLLMYSMASAQVVERGNATWVGLKPGVTYRLEGYEVSEHITPGEKNYTRSAYIKRDGDKEPRLFYTHGRQIVVTLGHRRSLVLIKVVVANLNSGEKRRIHSAALKMYRQHARPDRRLWIVPEAYGFSPHDRQVLIRMVNADVSAATAEESARSSKTYKEWWYVVGSGNGQVVRESGRIKYRGGGGRLIGAAVSNEVIRADRELACLSHREIHVTSYSVCYFVGCCA